MEKKIRLAVLFGGKSAEHEVSLQSAKNIVAALDTRLFEPVLIGIDKEGGWHAVAPEFLLESSSIPQLPAGTSTVTISQQGLTTEKQSLGTIDVVFPVLHGPLGEDGTVQGLLRLAGIPFVGSDVLGSAVGMDKDVMKRLLRDAGLPVSQFITIRAHERSTVSFEHIKETLGLPVFVKPANMGSSVGVSKVRTQEELTHALEEAFKFDTKILIEEEVKGEEVECAVLGNEHPRASIPGKIIPRADFYSYDAKYIDPNGAALEIPAQLPEDVVKHIQDIAIQAFQVLECSGMARVDMFVDASGTVTVNEINTIPGFTKISMYPKLWEASGISYSALITELAQLAIQRSEQQKQLQTSHTAA